MINKIKRKIQQKLKKEIHIISFPKSGRTWSSIMLGKYLMYSFNIKGHQTYDISKELLTLSKDLGFLFPKIVVHHDGRTFYQKPEEITLDKSKYKKRKVILLVRDPRDIIVSAYYERNKRVPKRIHLNESKDEIPFDGSIKEFVYQDLGGIDTIIKFYNNWLEQKNIPKGFMIVRYEDLIDNTIDELTRMLKFIGIKKVNQSIIEKVCNETTVEKLREEEKSKKYGSYALQPGDENDPNSFKVRKGKAGGYVDSLEKEEIDFLTAKIKDNLNPFFKY